MRAVYISGLLAVVTTLPLHGEAPAPSFLLFQLDNDLFSNTDQNYTNGLRLALLRPIPAQQLSRMQRWMEPLTRSGKPENTSYTWGTGLSQLMFTPKEHEALIPPPGQRPYAGWLGLELSLHAHNPQALNSFSLIIGTTGKPSFAKKAQDFVHEHVSNSPLFQGWDTQAPFELTLSLHYDRKKSFNLLDNVLQDSVFDVDGFLEYGAALGNFRTDAYVGIMVGFGYNLPGTYVYPRVQVGSYAHRVPGREERLKNPFSAAVFAGLRGTAVLHDITLDGPLFRNWEHSVNSTPWVGEYVVGFGFRFASFGLIFSRSLRTKEFSGQQNNHRFGSIQVSMGF